MFANKGIRCFSMPYVKKMSEDWVGIELELYNKVGALHGVTEKITSLGINIEYLETTEITDDIYKLFMVLRSKDPNNFVNLINELLN